MAVIKVEKYNTIEEFRVKTNLISDVVGDQSTLTSFSNSTNLIAALQELSGSSKGAIAVKQVIEGAYGWTMTPFNDSDIPPSITYVKGTDEVRCDLTWVNDNPTVAIYKYKIGVGVYSTIITETIAYSEGTGNVTSITWTLG